MIRHQIFHWACAIVAGLSVAGCNPEEVRFEDNPIPSYSGVPTVLVDAYLTRAYIDLIGREPLPGELETARTALRTDDLSPAARLDLIERLMGADSTYKQAHDRKLFDDLSGQFLNGTSLEGLLSLAASERASAEQDSLAGGSAYPFFLERARRLDSTAAAIEAFQADAINWREVNRRFCDNLVYDEINMNSFNFINASFDDLFGRYPTESEYEQAFSAIEFGAPAVLLGNVIVNKDDYLNTMVGNAEFDEGATRWWAEKLLVRPITVAEMVAWRDVAGPDVDIRALMRLLIASDEYADFQ